MRLLPCGDLAILVELEDAAHRRRLDASLRANPIPGVREHIPAAHTVLVTVAHPADLPAVAGRLRSITLTAADEPPPEGEPPVVITVSYDGADLSEVAHHLRVSAAEVVARHTGQLWRVEFSGFAPGFGYLVGDVGGLDVPRRETPRTRIPPGSVALAGPYSGVYPRPSPGGWQLIGSTDAVIWDPRREPPAMFTPGRRVQFVERRR